MEDENENYHCVERRYGTFSRTMRLPFKVEADKADKVDATYNNGELKLTLPKSEPAKAKEIEIKS